MAILDEQRAGVGIAEEPETVRYPRGVLRECITRASSIPSHVCPQKLSSTAAEDWEPKRIQRPKGVPEWGVPPEEPPQKKP